MNQNLPNVTPSKVMEVAKKGWDAIVEMYKHSDKETRKVIIKTLGGLGSFGALLKFLSKL